MFIPNTTNNTNTVTTTTTSVSVAQPLSFGLHPSMSFVLPGENTECQRRPLVSSPNRAIVLLLEILHEVSSAFIRLRNISPATRLTGKSHYHFFFIDCRRFASPRFIQARIRAWTIHLLDYDTWHSANAPTHRYVLLYSDCILFIPVLIYALSLLIGIGISVIRLSIEIPERLLRARNSQPPDIIEKLVIVKLAEPLSKGKDQGGGIYSKDQGGEINQRPANYMHPCLAPNCLHTHKLLYHFNEAY